MRPWEVPRRALRPKHPKIRRRFTGGQKWIRFLSGRSGGSWLFSGSRNPSGCFQDPYQVDRSFDHAMSAEGGQQEAAHLGSLSPMSHSKPSVAKRSCSWHPWSNQYLNLQEGHLPQISNAPCSKYGSFRNPYGLTRSSDVTNGSVSL